MRLAFVCMIFAALTQTGPAEAATRFPCSQEHLMVGDGGPTPDDVAVTARNNTTERVNIFGLDGHRQRHYLGAANPDAEVSLHGKVGSVVVITDVKGACIGIYRAEIPPQDVFDISPDPVDYQDAGGPMSNVLELLALAIKCPVHVRTIPDPFTGKDSKDWEESRQARFFGSDSRFDLLLHKQQLDKSQNSGVLMFRTLRETIGASLHDIGEVKQVGPILTVSCSGNAKCLEDHIVTNPDRSICPASAPCHGSATEGFYWSDNTMALSKLNLRMCDDGAATDAAAALQLLLRNQARLAAAPTGK